MNTQSPSNTNASFSSIRSSYKLDGLRVLAHLKWIVLALAATSLGLIGYLLAGKLTPSQINITATPLTISQLQPIQELTVLRVPMTTVIEASRHGKLHLGGLRARLTVVGDARLSTNLEAGRLEQVDSVRHAAVLALPAPQVQAVVDMKKSQIYDIDRQGLWVLCIGEAGSEALINTAYAQAEGWIRDAGGRPEHIAQAKRQAEAVIVEFCAKLGWQVTVRWS